jgi:hypothetical protein
VAVHPDLPLPHAAHVQGHRRAAGRRGEVGLERSAAKKVQNCKVQQKWKRNS